MIFELNILGERLRKLRKDRGLVLADVAKLLGVTVTQISDLEHGKTGTTLPRLMRLAMFYRVSTDYLLGLTDNPQYGTSVWKESAKLDDDGDLDFK